MNCLLSLAEGDAFSWDDRGQAGLAVVDCLGVFCLGESQRCSTRCTMSYAVSSESVDSGASPDVEQNQLF